MLRICSQGGEREKESSGGCSSGKEGVGMEGATIGLDQRKAPVGDQVSAGTLAASST